MTTITALPTPPTRDDPINFADRADTFLGALPTFATETNAVASEINTKHNEVMTAEIIAENLRGQWVTAKAYALKDVYTDNGVAYIVVVSHTSTSIANDAANGKVKVWQGVLFSDLPDPSISGQLGHLPAGSGAVADTVKARLDETISVFCAMTPAQKADVLAKTYLIDVTAAINIAISVAAVMGKKLGVPAGGYLITPATNKTDEAGTNKCAFPMVSNMHIEAERGAVFKLANNVSTDAAPINHSMFFSNVPLEDVSIVGLTMDMNGANNKISPLRPVTYYNFTAAPICVSGTGAAGAGIAARIDRCLIRGCTFKNITGASGILMHHSNTVGTQLSSDWTVEYNTFHNVGLDCSDHSTIYGSSTNLRVNHNLFTNDVMYDWDAINEHGVGGLVAIEIHCSDTMAHGNIINNYAQGLWVTANFTEATVKNISICNNIARVGITFVDFWSHNVLPYGNPEGAIAGVNIIGNTIEITSDEVSTALKAFFSFNARLQPRRVMVANNVCRSFETLKDTCLALMIVRGGQLQTLDQITVSDNTAVGVSNGLIAYFFGDATSPTTRNIGRVRYQNNDLGFQNVSVNGFPASDIHLYGTTAGVIEALRTYGLRHPVAPITTDSFAGGRASVYGKAILPTAVTWNGITVGNGSSTSKIAIDTDMGIANMALNFVAGNTSAAIGNIYPSWTGITADATTAATGMHYKTGLSKAIAARVDNTATFISLFNDTGGSFAWDEFAITSVISVNANFPCRFASI